MILGVCATDFPCEAAAKNGFSYLEMSLSKVRALGGTELDEIRKKAESAGLTIDGCNCFFEKSFSLYGATEREILSYAEQNYDVVRRLRGEYCVIGSGQSRSVPEGMDPHQAEERFLNLMSLLAGKAKEYGIFLTVEPLRKSETNLINTLSDEIRFCRALNHPNVGCMVDLFHFFCNGEDLSEFDELRPGELRHVHLARPDASRSYPLAEDETVLRRWKSALQKAGYDGRISLECRWGEEKEKELETAGSAMKIFTR